VKDSATVRGAGLASNEYAEDASCPTNGENAGARETQSPEQPLAPVKEGTPVGFDDRGQQVFLACVRRQHAIVHADAPAEATGIAICHAKSRTTNEQIVRRHQPCREKLAINARVSRLFGNAWGQCIRI